MRSAHDHTERLSGVGPAVNAAVEDRGIGDQHVTRNASFADIESVAAAINLRVNAGTIILNQDVGLIVSDGGVQSHLVVLGPNGAQTVSCAARDLVPRHAPPLSTCFDLAVQDAATLHVERARK